LYGSNYRLSFKLINRPGLDVEAHGLLSKHLPPKWYPLPVRQTASREMMRREIKPLRRHAGNLLSQFLTYQLV
jgi:hypothetical protein